MTVKHCKHGGKTTIYFLKHWKKLFYSLVNIISSNSVGPIKKLARGPFNRHPCLVKKKKKVWMVWAEIKTHPNWCGDNDWWFAGRLWGKEQFCCLYWCLSCISWDLLLLQSGRPAISHSDVEGLGLDCRACVWGDEKGSRNSKYPI